MPFGYLLSPIPQNDMLAMLMKYHTTRVMSAAVRVMLKDHVQSEG